MTIDEAIALERQIAKDQRDHIGTWDDEYSKKCDVWSEEHEQIAKWLEKLKTLKDNSISKEAFEKMKTRAYKKGHRQGYNKAIDDVLRLPKYTFYDTSNEFMNIRIDAISIEDILKLKEQNHDKWKQSKPNRND